MEATIESRRQTLQNAINGYVIQGFEIITQNDTTAQLKKSKKFNWLIFTLGLLFAFIGAGIYIVYYMFQKSETIFIQVDANGSLQIRKG